MEPFFRFALSQPVSVAVIGCDDTRQLEENIASASSFQPLSEADKQGLIQKIEPYARQLMYYKP